MNLEQGTKFHDSWDVFLPNIRQEIQEKIQNNIKIQDQSSLSKLPMPRRNGPREEEA